MYASTQTSDKHKRTYTHSSLPPSPATNKAHSAHPPKHRHRRGPAGRRRPPAHHAPRSTAPSPASDLTHPKASSAAPYSNARFIPAPRLRSESGTAPNPVDPKTILPDGRSCGHGAWAEGLSGINRDDTVMPRGLFEISEAGIARGAL